jgi:hypothetical protein
VRALETDARSERAADAIVSVARSTLEAQVFQPSNQGADDAGSRRATRGSGMPAAFACRRAFSNT